MVGVLQGSILASLFFSVYMSEFADLCKTFFLLLCFNFAEFIATNEHMLKFQLNLSSVKQLSDERNLLLSVM